MDVCTRFAPSPTGILHLGNVRTALFSWLYARHHQGKFILRIEDTDRERSTQASIGAILESMEWLGLQADEGPIYQTDRLKRYQAIAEQLREQGDAYRCYCTVQELETMRNAQTERGEKPRYDGRCRERKDHPANTRFALRLKNPSTGQVRVHDLVFGEIEFANAELDDLVIVRSDGIPTYNFAVVVDDHDMSVSHVIRGDDHINNTPRQINIHYALKWKLPEYAHVPTILGPDGARLSKRHGAVNVLEYRDAGYLPEAMLNLLVRLGWSHGDQEIFSVDEMIELFDIADVNKSAASFNPERLLWLNQHYIQTLTSERLAGPLHEFLQQRGVDIDEGPDLRAVIEAQRTRCKTLVEMADASLFFYRDFDNFEPKSAKEHLRSVSLNLMLAARQALANTVDWDAATIHALIEKVADHASSKFGKVAQPLRVAVAGTAVSPPIDITLELVGRERCLDRIDRAIEFIQQRAA